MKWANEKDRNPYNIPVPSAGGRRSGLSNWDSIGIWCMVNKEAKIAVYFYDDGSRGRQVLRDFLDKTEDRKSVV